MLVLDIRFVDVLMLDNLINNYLNCALKRFSNECVQRVQVRTVASSLKLLIRSSLDRNRAACQMLDWRKRGATNELKHLFLVMADAEECKSSGQ
jgi:hypothetical protein